MSNTKIKWRVGDSNAFAAELKWLEEMSLAGAQREVDVPMTRYWRNKNGDRLEFSLDRARVDPAVRKELLAWAVGWHGSRL